jgi:hypothetical protein
MIPCNPCCFSWCPHCSRAADRRAFLQRHPRLPLQPRRFRRRRLLALLRPAPLANLLDRSGRGWRPYWLFACFDLGRVARDVADDQAFFLGRLDERGVQTLRQLRCGEFGKGARELRLMENLAVGSPNRKCAARRHRSSDDRVTAACRSCYRPPWPQRSRPWPAGAWPAGPRRRTTNRPAPRLNQTQHRDQLTVLVGQRPQLLLQRREQNPLHDQGNRIWIFPTLVAGRKVDSDDSPGFSKQKFAPLKAL